MALNLGSPCVTRFSYSSTHVSNFSPICRNCSKNNALLILLLSRYGCHINAFKNPSFPISASPFNVKNFIAKASLRDAGNKNAENSVPTILDDELLKQVLGAKDADEALEILAEMSKRSRGIVSNEDCRSIITAAFDRNNADLALSIYSAMRCSFDQGSLLPCDGASEQDSLFERWKWSRPDVSTYMLLVRGLAAALRVSDALRMIAEVCQVGVSPGEEVPFGKIVKCPSCMTAIAVAQPQHGIQVVSCFKCRYQYELVSGDIVSIESEEVSMDIPAWKRGLRFLKIMKQTIPAAVHSVVVQTPTGVARTHRFATGNVELPAQEGERVTISLAAPSNVYMQVGPLKLNPKPPGFYPGEPMCLTNHTDGRVSQVMRAPSKNGSSSFLNPSILFPFIAVLATGDAASGIIDPNMPQFITMAAIASLTIGATINSLVLPQLNRIPQRLVDVLAIKQQLLSQYDMLQSRIKDLRQAAKKECSRSRIKRVRESLESSLMARVELIDSYARISSMIEIEVEMDSDVLAAEAVSNAEIIAEQIQQMMELENLEERWRLQAEANDEMERLLSSQPVPEPEQV